MLLICSALFLGLGLLQETVAERIPLDELLPRREYGKYLQEDEYHEKIQILREAVEDRSERVETEIEDRNLAILFRTLAEIRGLSHHALELSLLEEDPDELRDKEVKRLEIQLRKLTEQLRYQKLAVPYESRSQFEQTEEIVERLRERLLQQLFGQAIALFERSQLTLAGTHQAFFWNEIGWPGAFPAYHFASAQGLHDIDKFTEEEFQKIQYAQKLEKRVEIFLEIAEARLSEIERRIAGRAWEEEEPNPLEFYTYTDLLHGYLRALDGIMVNIDEKYESRAASEEEIRKSLEKLDEGMDGYLDRLKEFEPLVRREKDLSLAKKYRDVLEVTDTAQKGVQYGLGKTAPEDED